MINIYQDKTPHGLLNEIARAIMDNRLGKSFYTIYSPFTASTGLGIGAD